MPTFLVIALAVLLWACGERNAALAQARSLFTNPQVEEEYRTTAPIARAPGPGYEGPYDPTGAWAARALGPNPRMAPEARQRLLEIQTEVAHAFEQLREGQITKEEFRARVFGPGGRHQGSN
jgi:hypothetical protein